MNAADTTCSECGTPRVNDTPGSECEKCGSTAITVHVFAAEAIAMSETVTWKMGPANTAPVRRDVLKASLADIQEAVQQNDARAAYIALKRALEAMHELEDCRNRQEWTPAGWTPDELNLWAAHMGARNAAHHTSSTVVGLHSEGSRDERLTWDLDSAAISSLRSPRQAAQYQARLAGQPVLPALRQLAARVDAAIG